jgi:hypothetical protein
LITALLAGSVLAQEPPPPRSANHVPRPEDRRPGGQGWNSGSRRGYYRDGGSSGPLVAFYKANQDEFKKVPLLNDRLKRLLDFQIQHIALQHRRFQLTQKTNEPTNTAFTQFHDLLKQDEALNQSQQKLVEQISTDVPQLVQQITARRTDLDNQIKQQAPDSPEQKRLQRLDRFYHFLQDRFADLPESQNRSEWMRRLMRGFAAPMEELDAQMLADIRNRLEQLQQEQDLLRRRLTEIDNQLLEIRDIMDASGRRNINSRRGNRFEKDRLEPRGPEDPKGMPEDDRRPPDMAER